MIRVRGLGKQFGRLQVLRSLDLDIEAGRVTAVLGPNGAGKTTLIKSILGLVRPDSGSIEVAGVRINGSGDYRAGIGYMPQLPRYPENLTVREILHMIRDLRGRFEDLDEELIELFDLAAQYEKPFKTLSGGNRQRVSAAIAFMFRPDLLILDEPTAVLTPQETDDLFAAVQRLVDQGKTVIFITHKLVEVKEISDRVTVMRRGQVTGCVETASVSEADIARMMVGRDVFLTVDKSPQPRGERVVEIRNLNCISETGLPLLTNVNLNLYAGEILGIAGVEGNGQTELAEVLSGLRPAALGEITVGGKLLEASNARAARLAGIAHIPEDRLANGVALDVSIAANLVVDRYNRRPFTHGGILSPGEVRRQADDLMQEFDIRAAGPHAPMSSLSGGNMQKVIVAREFSSNPIMLIAAQPTRGIDIGASEFVRNELVDLRDEGRAVLLISADLAEVMSLSDRIAVMHDGQIVAIFPNSPDLTEHELGLYMLGVKQQDASEMGAAM
jgi:general nucleoside transport system ATP-binding protein